MTKLNGIYRTEYKGWEVLVGKAATGGWLAKASREGISLEDRGVTRREAIESIHIAIDTELGNPWWK